VSYREDAYKVLAAMREIRRKIRTGDIDRVELYLAMVSAVKIASEVLDEWHSVLTAPGFLAAADLGKMAEVWERLSPYIEEIIRASAEEMAEVVRGAVKSFETQKGKPLYTLLTAASDGLGTARGVEGGSPAPYQ